jgi:hypothetical protein
MSLECVRIFADSEGNSHFGTASIDLFDVDFAPPAPRAEVSEIVDAKHGFLRMRSGWFGDWHPAPARQVMCLLQGEVEVEVSDGETRRASPGMIVLVEDTEGPGHTTRVVSEEAAVMVFAQLSQAYGRAI